MAWFYLARINTADKTTSTADFQAEAAVVFGKALVDLYEQYPNSPYDQCFRHLMATLPSLVGVGLVGLSHI